MGSSMAAAKTQRTAEEDEDQLICLIFHGSSGSCLKDLIELQLH